jgi:Transcriptional Coactivator p15 (PC4)
MAKNKKSAEPVIREIKLGPKGLLRINSFRNSAGIHINLRKFYLSGEEWKPSNQGLTLPYEKSKAAIRAIIECYKSAEDEAVELPEREKK